VHCHRYRNLDPSPLGKGDHSLRLADRPAAQDKLRHSAQDGGRGLTRIARGSAQPLSRPYLYAPSAPAGHLPRRGRIGRSGAGKAWP
jgi:hypothetical protein